MDWRRINASSKQLKDKIVLRRKRLRRDNRDSADLVDSSPARKDQSDAQTMGFCPDDYVRQSEFSLPIGC